MTTIPLQTENCGIAARYYAPPVFTSRDPLMNEKPWLTPYHYCSNNPIGRVDPSGMLDDEWEYNMGTKTMKWVSATGRDIGVDIVHVKTGDGIDMGSHVCENGLNSCELTGNTTDGYGFHSESLHIQDGYNSADFSYTTFRSDMSAGSSGSDGGTCLGELALATSIGTTMVGEAANSSVKVSNAAKEVEALKVFKGVSKVAKGLGFAGAAMGVLDALYDFSKASTTAGQIRAGINGIMNVVGMIPPWGTIASFAWGMADIGYGDKIFKQ